MLFDILLILNSYSSFHLSCFFHKYVKIFVKYIIYYIDLIKLKIYIFSL